MINNPVWFSEQRKATLSAFEAKLNDLIHKPGENVYYLLRNFVWLVSVLLTKDGKQSIQQTLK
jgi:hypothetical protein